MEVEYFEPLTHKIEQISGLIYHAAIQFTLFILNWLLSLENGLYVKKTKIQNTIEKEEEETKESNPTEFLLTPNKNRFVLFPIRYHKIWQMYKKHEAGFWTAEEVDLSHDYKDWLTLNENEQHFLKHVLAFFAASDGE